MIRKDSMDVGDLPSPTQSVDPFTPSSLRVIAPLVDTSSIPRF